MYFYIKIDTHTSNITNKRITSNGEYNSIAIHYRSETELIAGTYTINVYGYTSSANYVDIIQSSLFVLGNLS